MTAMQERDELHRRIWQIANDLRGAVDGWTFMHFILGALFYRYISENFAAYMEGGDPEVCYADIPDDLITPDIKDDAIRSRGYFIYPSQLFSNVAAQARLNSSLNTDLAQIFHAIENSANGYPSESRIQGIFADFDTTSARLGSTVKEKNQRLAALLRGIAEMPFSDFSSSLIDVFGDAYEFLISNYAANAGKAGGEFFTPGCVSRLISRLAIGNAKKVNAIYDPAAGSGSLLLHARRQFDEHIIENGFFGQEINHLTWNLGRMNMFLHNINYENFDLRLGDTLIHPQLGELAPFDAIVSNPPYSLKWIGKDDPTLINDDRYASAGALAPKSAADFAFILHALHYLSANGKAAIVCFPGIFYRGGAEQKIRKYLAENGFIETIIALPPNLFYGTSIAVNILVLNKGKKDDKIRFVDAGKLFKKEVNNNILLDEHIEKILEGASGSKDMEHFAISVPLAEIAARDWNLSVSSYVEPEDTRERLEIGAINAELSDVVGRIKALRHEISRITAEIEDLQP